MKTRNGKIRVSVLALAVEAALVAMYAVSAYADDEEAAALKTPTNYVEIGASSTSASSAKFGEYSGLNKSGVDVIGNFSVRGGDAYGDSKGTQRWSVTGNDLGLTSRSLDATVTNQGQWSFGIGYDELRHNISDSYQTPYNGSMGGNAFTLPAGYITPAITNTNAMSAAQTSALHTVDIGTTRKNTSFNAGFNFNQQWDIKFDFNHLDQSGAKLMSFGSMANATLAPGVTGEAVSILPNPTNYNTDTFNLALNWIGDKSHVTVSYYGSFFHDNYDRVTFDTFAGTANANQLMSTAPSNEFHQLNLSGGYALSPQTNLTGGLSYGRNTQNDTYVTDGISMVTPYTYPKASLAGLVVNTHADLKLTNQTSKDLILSAGLKYDERNDRTDSNFYYFNALDGAVNHQAYFPNTPYSNSKTQLELAGDYRLNKDQRIRLAYNRENIRRWCEQYAVGGIGAQGTNGISSFPAGANCVVATNSADDKLSATYKLKASEDVNMNVGYSYSKRITNSDPNAITARIGLNGNVNPSTTTSDIMGQNAGDFRGFYPFFDASRVEQMLKAGINWQTTEKISVGISGRYTDVLYDSTYGVQNGNKWSLNLDTSYSYSDNGSISAYVTQEHRQRDLNDLQRSPYSAAAAGTTTAIAIPSGATWTDKLRDDDFTLGFGVKQNGLMGGKLGLTGDLSYSLGKTGYGTQLNYSTTTGGNPLGTPPFLTCSSPQIMSCGDLPDIQNTVIQLRLIGNYQVDKSAKVTAGYIYKYMESTDYYYNGLQSGYSPNALMPTNQQSPNYAIHAVIATYTYMFK